MFNLSYTQFAQAWRRYAALDHRSLFETLGWAEPAGPPGLRNGAVLTSLALLSCGIPVRGSLPIEAGPLAGSKVFNGANQLADWFGERHGAPETLSLEPGLNDIADQLFGRRGIIAFIQGNGPQGGLIGRLDSHNASPICAAAASKHPLEVRFWPLP